MSPLPHIIARHSPGGNPTDIMLHPDAYNTMDYNHLSKNEPAPPTVKPFDSEDVDHLFQRATRVWPPCYGAPGDEPPLNGFIRKSDTSSVDDGFRYDHDNLHPQPEYISPSGLGTAMIGMPPPTLPARSRRHSPSSYVLVPQRQYGLGTETKNVPYPGCTVYFGTYSGALIRLADALSGVTNDLIAADAPWFPKGDPNYLNIGTKISVRLHFESEGFQEFFRQVMSLRSTAAAPPINLEALAKNVAKSTQQYLRGRKFNVDGELYGFGDLYLVELQRMSHGSWQPVFYVQRR
ncbi:hypothetical protein C8Q73DRAFT_235387 [Cubamyces lactineus]|nr:hypothetical protein C8Q73DRAFT_235387 [Cubamyces lactineus]